MNGNNLIPLNLLGKFEDFQHQIKSKFNKIFSSDDESSSGDDYRRKYLQWQQRLPEHVKQQKEIFNEFFSKKVTPTKQRILSAHSQTPKNALSFIKIHDLSDQSLKQPFPLPAHPQTYMQSPILVENTPSSNFLLEKKQQRRSYQNNQEQEIDRRNILNQKSLERLEKTYLNSNYLQHIESKLRLGIQDQQQQQTQNICKSVSNVLQIQRKQNIKHSLINLSPKKPEHPGIQAKQNQTHRLNSGPSLMKQMYNIPINQQQNKISFENSDKTHLLQSFKHPQNLKESNFQAQLALQRIQFQVKDKIVPQLNTRMDIENSRIREKKLKKDKPYRSKKHRRNNEQIQIDDVSQTQRGSNNNGRQDTEEQIVVKDLEKRRQRSQSFKKKQIDRYLMKVSYEEEAGDDECNISDDKSAEECPVNKNDQRKYEIERFVFKMSVQHEHIESSHQWFDTIKTVREENNQKLLQTTIDPTINNPQFIQTNIQKQIRRIIDQTALQNPQKIIKRQSIQTHEQISNKITAQEIQNILKKPKRFDSVENFNKTATTFRKLSQNCNNSIVSTKRAPLNSNNLRLSMKDDPDKLMPVETMEENDESDDLSKNEKLFQSVSKTSVNQKETQPSLNNQSMQQDSPSVKQDIKPKTVRQKQMQQVSNYLKSYQQNLFNKKKSHQQNNEINQKINLIGNQINNRLLKMVMAKEDLKDPKTIKQIRQLILAGISNEVRKKLWAHLIFNKELTKQFPRSSFRKNYLDYNKSGALKDIKKDVRRTFQQVFYFKVPTENEEAESQYDYTRNPLTNILVAYSNCDRQIGYTQGMNYLAAMFYMVFLDEYESFLALHYVMYSLSWRFVYQHSTPKLQNLLMSVQRKLYNHSPVIYNYLQDKNVLPTAVYSQLFFTLGLSNCSLEHAYQIVDLFLLEGEKILIKLIINCLKLKQKRILTLEQEFEICQYLQQQMLKECLKEYGLKGIIDYENGKNNIVENSD